MVQRMGSECEGGSQWSFLRSIPFTNTCLVEWSENHTTQFAFVWAVLIHALASGEHLDIPHRALRFLEDSPILQSLSSFSLQLFLGHWVIYRFWMRLSALLLFRGEWEMNTIFIAVYGTSCAFKAIAQPSLDYCLLCAVGTPDGEDETVPLQHDNNHNSGYEATTMTSYSFTSETLTLSSECSIVQR
jgi:hypothetical protein